VPKKTLLALTAILLLLACGEKEGPVSPDTTAPQVAISNLVNNNILGTSFLIKVDATDNEGVERVSFYVDELKIGEDNSEEEGWSFLWHLGYWANELDAVTLSLSVVAEDASGNSKTSGSVPVILLPDACIAPTPSGPTDGYFVDNTRVACDWEPLPDALVYQIQIADSDDFSNILIDLSVPESELPAEGLAAESFYYWRVRGQNVHELWSSWSNFWSFMPRDIPLLSPDSPESVLENMALGIEWKVLSGYEDSLHEDFLFIPNFEDKEEARDQGKYGFFNDFTKTRASDLVFTLNDESVSTVFDFSFDAEDLSLDEEAGTAELSRVDYTITVNWGSSTQVYVGWASADFLREDGNWSILEWSEAGSVYNFEDIRFGILWLELSNY
jgi:hypothetical protein